LSTKSEYKTDDEDFNNYSNHGGNEIASDSDLDDDDTYESRNIDTEEAMKKAFKRISLAPAAFAAAKACRASVSGSHSRFSAFMNEKVVEEEEEEEDSSVLTCDTTTTTITTTTSSELVFGTILSSIFEYLSSKDIISSTSLVSKTWFAQSTHILSWRAATDMTFSNYKKNSSQGRGVGGKKHMNASERAAALVSSKRSWAAFLECYPWGKFLAEGAYKSVYKVWSAPRRRMEAISVMDINAIAETGNLPVIQAEIQAACLLSHLVRTNVCPNFLNTFQVFVFGASPSNQEDDDFQGLWGSPTSGHEEEEGQQNRDDSCPFDSVYIPNVTVAKQILSSSTSSTSQSALLHKRAKKCSLLIQSLKEQLPSQFTSTTTSQGASYQYIRMELCSSGDVEELLRRREPGVLALEMEACKASVGNRGGEAYRAAQLALQRADAQAANDAAQMAFQMAFSLYAARERLSFRHFDVKLLNFLAKPAVDLANEEVHEKNVIEKSDSTSIVRLCYSIGERNVNVDLPLRGESKSGRTGSGQEDDDLSSSGHIIKLADYGTANTNPNTIEKPVHYTHFTTLENSPPEYLILGDAATQGYGADTWALGLCILHLFTGSCPYEEMMTTVSRDEDEELLLSQETNSAGATQKSSTNGKKSNVIGVVCPQPLKDALRKVWMTTEVSSVSTTSSSSGTLQKEKSTKTSAKSKKVIESTTIPTTSSSSAAAFEQNDSIKRKAVCRAFFTSLGVSAEWIAEDEVGVCDATTTAFPSSSSSSSNASYRVIRKVLESSGDVEETADILADTLYRYAVLLGLPEEDKNKDGNCSYATSNPVWVLLNAACKGIESLSCASSLGTFDDSDATKGGTKKQVKNKTTAKKSTKKNENVTSNSPSSAILLTLSEITACSLQYKADQRFASVKLGTNFLLQRARRRSDALFFSSQLHVSKKDSRLKSSLSTSTSLKGTGDSVKTGCCNLLLDLVCSNKNGLLAWNVKARPTMASFIQNEVLHNGVMFEQQSNGDNRIDKDEEENIIFEKKISYYGNSQGGQNCLPCDV
jgi:serine/threonine protein kinase